MLENLKNTSLWIFEVQSEGYLLSGSGVNVVFKFSTLPTGRPDMKINRGASEKDMDISDLLAQQSLAGHSWEVGSRVYPPISCHIPLSVEPQFKAKSFSFYYSYLINETSTYSQQLAESQSILHIHMVIPHDILSSIFWAENKWGTTHPSRKQNRYDPPEGEWIRPGLADAAVRELTPASHFSFELWRHLSLRYFYLFFQWVWEVIEESFGKTRRRGKFKSRRLPNILLWRRSPSHFLPFSWLPLSSLTVWEVTEVSFGEKSLEDALAG